MGATLKLFCHSVWSVEIDEIIVEIELENKSWSRKIMNKDKTLAIINTIIWLSLNIKGSLDAIEAT